MSPVNLNGYQPGAGTNLLQGQGSPQDQAARTQIGSQLFPGVDPASYDQFSQQILDSIMSLPPTARAQFADNFNPQAYQTALPIVSGQYAMDTAMSDLQRQGLNQGLGHGIQDLMNGNMDMFADYQNNLQGLNLQRQALGVQNQGLNQDLGYYKALQGLAGQTYQNAIGGYDLADTGYNRDYNTGMRNLRADATQRGAYISPGFVADKADTGAKLDQQLAGTQLGRQQAGITRDQSVLGAQHAMQGVRQQLAQNGITAQQFGLDQHKFEQGLSRGMRQLGIDSQRGMEAIQQQLDQNEITGGANTLQFIQSLLEAAGVYDNQG